MLYRNILFLFFLSGLLGLGYQVLWSKYLLDFIGVSAYSYATVLGAFMAGLAIGSWLLGKWADRSRSPLKLYAYLELAIGVYAILYLPLMRLASDAYAGMVSFTPEQAGGTFGLGAKIAVAAVLLLPPTILMGGTFPVLLKHVTRNIGALGRNASQLYSANALGAVAGTLTITFLFIPTLGMAASLMFLAASNAIVAAWALLLSGVSSSSIADPLPTNTVESSGALVENWQLRLVLVLIFVEGLLAFAYEIAWTRFFGMVLGSSTYSFSIMLAAFISGISLGSAWLGRIGHRVKNPLSFFGWTQVIVGLLVILVLPLYPFVPWFFHQFGDLLSFRPGAYYLYELGKLFFCYLIMLPPTIFIGMSLPLVVRGMSRSLEQVGSDAGRIYSWNTCGNVLGALLAGLLLLPVLGTQRLLSWSSVGTCLLGVVAFVIYRPRSRTLASAISSGAAVLLCVVIYEALFSGWDPRWFTLVPFRRTGSSSTLPEARAILSRREILLFKDDPAAHLMVEKRNVAGKEKLRLFVNGKVDGSSDEDMITQVLSAHLPLLLHPRPSDILIIGLATGVTSGSALTHSIKRVDVVEIVRAMPEATALFRRVNQSPDSDPRFHLIVDDARSYLSYTRQQYDVIIAEPSNPWMAGTGSLFSKDFYRRASGNLRPDGIYLQWIQAYELGEETFAAVVRSFRTIFPYVYGFQTVSADVLLLGSRQPLRPDWPSVESRFQQPAVSRDLGRVHVRSLSALLYLQRFSPGTIDFLGSLTQLENTDDNHLLEYRAPRDLFLRVSPDILEEIDERFSASPALFWNQFAARNPGNHSLPQTLQLLLSRDVGIPALIEANQLALYHLNGSSLPSKERGLFPDSFFFPAPPSEAQIAGRVNDLLKGNSGVRPFDLLDSYDTAILTEAALSPEKAQFWLEQIRTWTRSDTGSRMDPKLRVFRIQLLTATRQTETAANELLSWVRGDAPPPPPRWALLVASQIDPVKLRPAVIEAYRSRK